MLQNAYLVAKFRFDTKIMSRSKRVMSRRWSANECRGARSRRPRPGSVETERLFSSIGHDASLFSRLVLGCIETKFCIQIRILQHFSKSSELSSWNFKILQNFAKNHRFLTKIWKFWKNVFAKFKFCEILRNFAKFYKI